MAERSPQTVRLVAFASAADALHTDATELEVETGSTVGQLLDRLEGDFPALAPIRSRLAVALDGRIAGADDVIPAGAEVALLPPVSGGSGAPWLTAEAIAVESVVRRVAGPRRGATSVFIGTVRNHHGGRPVEGLDYQAYESMAEAVLRRIVEELEAADPDLRVAVVHRLGAVPVGEASVVIAAASPHRDAATTATRTTLERLKREVPIWKRERYADGSEVWREEEPLAHSSNA